MRRTLDLLMRCFLVSTLFCGAWLLQYATSRANTAEEKRALSKAKALHRRGGYPTHLPKGKPPPRPRKGCDPPRILPSGLGAGCGQFASWMLLGIVLALLLTAVLPSIAHWRKQALLVTQTTEVQEAEPYTPEVLGRTIDAGMSLEDFLRAQDWEGAICFLLYQAMRNLGWTHKGKGKSQTAREVIFQVPASEGRAAPLYALLQMAEKIRFGGIDADRALFDQAQEKLQEFQRQSPQNQPSQDQKAGPPQASHIDRGV